MACPPALVEVKSTVVCPFASVGAAAETNVPPSDVLKVITLPASGEPPILRVAVTVVVAIPSAGMRGLAAASTREKAVGSAQEVVPGGQVEQVDGDPELHTRPEESQVIPMQAG